MHIIGTAGHVDAGKSSLVYALTGTDPDRWIEEQRRGMTLDLGFAHLTFDDGVEAGIIDVPGHERFLHNMLAGAAGMELVLLVIAASEGPQLQTFEHLAILEFLAVRQTLVVLTKSDLFESSELAAAELRVRAALQGTSAADAPLFAVSTRSGDGLPALRAALHSALVALPSRSPNAPAYLPIDRVFARVGHGTVVTGTLMQGQIATGATLRLSPLGRDVRVRGLQVFGVKVDRVAGGTRVAVNVAGVETTEIARGAVLASPQLQTAGKFAITFRALPAALPLLKRRTPVRAYIGSAEILGTIVFPRVPDSVAAVAGELHLRTATIAVPNAPFVVRRISPMDVLGGGTLAVQSVAQAAIDPHDDVERRAILSVVSAAGLNGATAIQIGATANLAEARVNSIVAELLADGLVRVLSKPPALIAAHVADDLLTAAVTTMRERQHERPWLMGITSLALSQTLKIAEPALIRVLAAFSDEGTIAYRSGYYATTDFTPQLGAEQRAFFDRVFAEAPGTQPAPIDFEQLRALIKTSRVPELSQAFDTLVASGALSKVGPFVYRGSHLAAIRSQLEATLRRQRTLTVAEFRTLTGTSRKYAVPLLEFFDATGVTLRTGDLRILRQTATAQASGGPADIVKSGKAVINAKLFERS